jgi:hypothetical protein
MAEITVTDRRPRLIHDARAQTGPEIWAAETVDGVWGIEREDSPGTPWLVFHRPSVKDGTCPDPVMEFGSLRVCQVNIADAEYAAWALADAKDRYARLMATIAGIEGRKPAA